VRRACAIALCILLAGCVTVDLAHPFRPPPAPEGFDSDRTIWPARWAPQRWRTRGVVVADANETGRLVGVRVPPDRAVNPLEEDIEDARALAETMPGGSVAFSWEGPGSYVFRRIEASPRSLKPDLLFRYVSGTPVRENNRTVVRLERTWFAYYEAEGGPPRGIALVIPGMFGTPRESVDGFVRRMRREGVAVVRMLSHPSRFTERVEFDIDLDRMDRSAEQVASVLTGRAAECAYAAEAAFDYLARERPETVGVPRIGVGMSGGAMVLPTVMAREPGAYAAAVNIAGGCDFWSINFESNYADFIDAIKVHFTPREPTGDDLAAFARAYLAHAPLDSYNTAPVVAAVPTLMIHGSGDRAVPAYLGDELWERLGRPERRVVPLGHELLFLTLGTQMDAIVEFLERHALAPES